MTSALSQGLACCPICYKANRVTRQRIQCRRCKTQFYPRKRYSMQFCLAWTMAALIFFIPANYFPIMNFTTVGVDSPTTVLQGIQTLIKLGMYPIAMVVFVASFIVPIGKIIGLILLTWGVKHSSSLTPKQRTRLFILIDYLGPWSMLDVFVVTLMAAVVSLGFLTHISAGSGLTYFTLMVIFTMLAAHSFDPRLIWDKHLNDGNKNTNRT